MTALFISVHKVNYRPYAQHYGSGRFIGKVKIAFEAFVIASC